MALKTPIGNKSQAAHLRRLAVVFAVEVRLKIVTELYMREMSPKQFYEEFGGGSISRVTRNFDKLREHGWLRQVRSEGPGGRRRGAVEHFYRATELAFFDTPSWATMPYSIRVTSTWNMFSRIVPRMREAIEGATAAKAPRHDLDCTELLLDEVGWERVFEALAQQFSSQFEEQEDSKLRVAHSGEELTRRDVFVFSFEAPRRGRTHAGPALVENRREPLVPFSERLYPILADEVCRQIVAELNEREMSVTEFFREFGEAPSGAIRRRFKTLEAVGWLKKVSEETGGRRRGATEHFYRATKPATVDEDPWALPGALAGAREWRVFERFGKKIKESVDAGTFDERIDRVVTWSLLSLDSQGWENVIGSLRGLSAFLLEEQERARERMRADGGEDQAIRATVVLGAYDAPEDAAKAP